MDINRAVKIKKACDPRDCDCDNCPIGKPVEFDVADSGVWIRSTICGLLLWIEDFKDLAVVDRATGADGIHSYDNLAQAGRTEKELPDYITAYLLKSG